MPKVLYIEPYSGIAGDMFVASILGLLPDHRLFLNQLYSLPVGKEFEISIKTVSQNGIKANLFSVVLKDTAKQHKARTLSEILSIINGGQKLSIKSKDIAINIFNKLATAEAAVHDCEVKHVHFHEVGAIDAIVDIVSAAIILDLLNIDQVISAPVSVGTGTVKTCHGILPIPAPATAELLKNIPINYTSIKSELTTPTGAAILVSIVDSWETNISGKIINTSYGAGTKGLKEQANVLRVSLIDDDLITDCTNEKVAIIECNIDDFAGEHLSYIGPELLNLGALDYSIIPVTMKKNRQGIIIQVIAPLTLQDKLSDFLLNETPTLGIRYRIETRKTLERDSKTVTTPLGKIKVKLGYNKKSIIKAKPEQTDIAKIARKNNLSYNATLNKINYYIQKWIDEKCKK